jgi:hypothetical protein
VGLKEMVKGETLLGGWIWDEKEPLKEGWGEKGFSPSFKGGGWEKI